MKLLNHPNYDHDLPTVLYGFGFTESYQSKSTQMIVSSYIERGGHNILVIEWSNYSAGNYLFEAIPNVHKVGDVVGKTLWSMKKSGFKLENLHLVGHSLGAHLFGAAGRSVFQSSKWSFKMKRITALDPAGPFFYGFASIFNRPLSKDDGSVIRT